MLDGIFEITHFIASEMKNPKARDEKSESQRNLGTFSRQHRMYKRVSSAWQGAVLLFGGCNAWLRLRVRCGPK